jgi:alkylated DNA repair protein (DNA oxidative demethylase)
MRSLVLTDLFEDVRERERLDEGAYLFPRFALREAAGLIAEVERISAAAPFRNLVTPGGHTMSVAMTNCGAAGWVSDRRGYRYDAVDPLTGRKWPAMPDGFSGLADRAAAAAGFDGFLPDVCLINRYEIGAKLHLHIDRDEHDYAHPIVSVSLGLPAVFMWGGKARTDKPSRHAVHHGDVVVFGGPSRRHYHGVSPLKAGTHELTGACRFNLTFRKALKN